VVRLLPKVAGVPKASQLRPITLLCTDYKLLTKMFVARLLPLLPSLLTSTQLCSVRGRSIFDGGLAILSSIQHLQHKKLPGFLVSLDLFHAYDRVDLRWVEKVLEAMGFGPLFRGWIQTLHRGASACFMLHGLTPFLLILFSIRQGDPLAMLLFILQIEPLLQRLQRDLTGLSVGLAREASLGYVDDVAALGQDEGDLLKLDEAVGDFEAVSGAILNRNRKSVIVGLGSWEGRADWPLHWLQVAPQVKVYGFVFSASVEETIRLSWDRVVTGLEATLRLWSARHLPTLAARRLALETYGLSRLWYFAQLLPLPRAA
jgi:Reverse transcriptase (RNA-dependent DNA polymerase)